MTKLFISALLLLCFTAGLQAQETTGTIRFYFSPPAEAVTIDGKLLDYGNTAVLPAGKYFIQAWSPDKKILDTILEVQQGQINRFFYRFEDSKAFQEHQLVVKEYNQERSKHFAIPMTATLVCAGLITINYFQGKKLEDETIEAYNSYKYEHTEIKKKKAEFEEVQDKYRRNYYIQYAEYAGLAVSSYFLYKGIKWLIAHPKPQKVEDKNPFKVKSVGMTTDQFGSYKIGLTLNFN